MRRFNLNQLRKIFVNKSFVRYVSVGLIYTFSTPFIFVFLTQYVSRINAIIIFYPIGYLIKYFIFKEWVFCNDSVNLSKFLIHVIPIFFISLFFTHLTNFIHDVYHVAFMLVIVSGVSGYIWGKLIYKRNKS